MANTEIRSWLARLPGELPHQQMDRIRHTCRWCGMYFKPDPHGLARVELGRHEMIHVRAGDE